MVAAAVAALPSWARAEPRAALPGEATLLPTLATVYTGQVDPALCFISEKYDGVRALWDGRVLRHRSGRTVSSSAAFLATLPREPLDGELWLGRGRFDALSAIVRRVEPRDAEWAGVRYMVFEMPAANGSFAERLERLAAVTARVGSPQIELAPQRRGADRAELARSLAAVVAAGGEGLMLHLASAPYAGGRSDALLKLKPHRDAEAVVVGHQPGAGKYRGSVGALEVEAPDGRRFFIGSGLSDAARRDPPAIGSVVTYRYRDLTSLGQPRFATFVRRHELL
jgi:DNA ligase-1